MPPLRRAALLDSHIGDHLLGVLSAASAHSHAPEGERKGPIAKQWVGEVVANKHGIFLVRASEPTSPSRASRGPLPLPPLRRAERAFESRCLITIARSGRRGHQGRGS